MIVHQCGFPGSIGRDGLRVDLEIPISPSRLPANSPHINCMKTRTGQEGKAQRVILKMVRIPGKHGNTLRCRVPRCSIPQSTAIMKDPPSP